MPLCACVRVCVLRNGGGGGGGGVLLLISLSSRQYANKFLMTYFETKPKLAKDNIRKIKAVKLLHSFFINRSI